FHYPTFYLFLSPTSPIFSFFFFNAPATTEIYTLSLHDALPISRHSRHRPANCDAGPSIDLMHRCDHSQSALFRILTQRFAETCRDRKSTRLNSSHLGISYAVFCLKKKKKKKKNKNNKNNKINII